MAYLDDLIAAQDTLYTLMGVAATWTPAGGSPVSCTGLVGGGDQPARFHGLVAELNVQPRTLRVRVRELAAAAPGVTPREGDAVTTSDGGFLITGDPRQEDSRRLEWTFDLAAA